MAENKRYRVLRRHLGDRYYEPGEFREGTEKELGHLVPRVLKEEPAAKAEPAAPQNKAEGAAPANKAARKGKGKR